MGGCCIGYCCVMDNPVGDFFRDIFCSDSGCGYHPSVSENEQHAKKIANELAEMKENIRKSTEKDESTLLDYVNQSMDLFLRELEQLNNELFGGKSLHIDIDGIRKQKEILKDQVKGHIGNVMDERLVLTDKELSVILEERDDKKRGKNFDNFVKNVKKQALITLQDKIEIVVRAQSNIVKKEIEGRLKEVKQNLQETERAYSEILNAKENGGIQKEEQQIKFMYHYELYSLLLKQLVE